MTQHGLLVLPREAVQALARYRVAPLHGDVKLGAPWQALAVQHNRGRMCGLDCGWKQVRPGQSHWGAGGPQTLTYDVNIVGEALTIQDGFSVAK